MMQEIASKYPMTEWPLPPPLPRVEIHPHVYVCPYVGLPLKMSTDRYDLKRIWFHYDIKSWHIDEFRRVALYNLMKRNLDNWQEWLRFDSTPKFYKIISRLRKEKDGAVIGIAGPKRSGKSIFGQMVLTRVVDSIPHVLFRYRDFEKHVENISDLAIGVQVDEDLKATGSESHNLVIHVNNAFETSRKAELWAICTGVNLSFEGWGETLDLRLIPWGFNTRFQATRAAVLDKERDFLGFMVLQRKHLPQDQVYYAEEAGLWGEYKARAIEYSRSIIREGGATGAVDDVMQDRHVAALKDYLSINYVVPSKKIPSDLMCRRLYRKAKLPEKSVSYMIEIIKWAKEELELKEEIEEEEEMPRDVGIYLSDWEALRAEIERASKCQETALYYVPFKKKANTREIIEEYELDMLQDTFRKNKNRGMTRIGTTELGRIGERWLASRIDSIPAPTVGSGTHDEPDILLPLPDGSEIAVNVKLSLEDHVRREFPTTPEDRWMPRAAVALVMPRLLQISLFPITGQSMTLNSTKGRLCAPGLIMEALEEMFEHE